jgi:NitT/TauT family transport system substrate-binding protein
MSRGVMNRSAAVKLIAGGCVGVAAGAPRRATAQVQKLRVAGIPIDIAGAAYYALDQGFFSKYGLDVEIVQLANGAVVAAAVAGGSIDIGNGNSIAMATAHEHGIPFKLIAPSGAYNKSDPTSGIIVPEGSPIKTASDLNGKIIGVNGLRNIAEIQTRAWIDKNGGNSSTVQFVEMTFAEAAPGILSGRVAAGEIEEPQLDAALASGLRSIGSPGEAIASVWIEGGYFCNASFAQEHPDVVKKVASAIRDANDWANKNHAAAWAILAKYSKATLMPKHRVYYPARLDAAQLQPLIDAAARYGVLKATFPASDLFVQGL